MRRLLRLAVAVLFGLVLAIVTSTAVVLAAGAPAATNLQLTTTPRMDAKGHKLPGQLLIVVTLKTTAGEPVNGQQVSIYERGQFMGQTRDARIGTAITDSTGGAAIAYQPAQTGAHTLVALTADSAQYAAASANATVQVTQAVAPFPTQPEPLASVRHWLSIGVGNIVLAFWIVLLGLFLRTVIGIRFAHPVAEVEEASGLRSLELATSTPDGGTQE